MQVKCSISLPRALTGYMRAAGIFGLLFSSAGSPGFQALATFRHGMLSTYFRAPTLWTLRETVASGRPTSAVH